MKILYYSTSYYANHGGSIQSIEFYKHLKSNPEIEVSLFPDTNKERLKKPHVESSLKQTLKRYGIFQVLSFFRRNNFYKENLELRLTEFKPDVLIMQMDSNFLQIRNIKNKFPDLLICAQINGSPFDEFYSNIAFKTWFVNQQMKAYKNCDLNFFISEFSRSRIMMGGLDEKRDKVLYNGTDINKFFPIKDKVSLRNRLGYPLDKTLIGYIGTLDFHKKIIRLIDAFKIVSKDQPELELVIIGDGPAYKKLRNYIEDNKLLEKVHLKGWILHEEVNEHLNCFDIAVHHYANHYMNPLKIFEYLAAGLPVIGPDIPSVRTLFKHKEEILISEKDNSVLADEIRMLVEDKDFRVKLGTNEALLNKMAGEYTWTAYTNRVLSYINGKR